MWWVELWHYWHCDKSVGEEYGILSGRETDADGNMAFSGQLYQPEKVSKSCRLYMYASQCSNRIECVSRLNAAPLALLAIWAFLRHLGLACSKGCDVN